jgi:hypothetical protein
MLKEVPNLHSHAALPALTMSYPKLYLKNSSGVSEEGNLLGKLKKYLSVKEGRIGYRFRLDEFRHLCMYFLCFVLTGIAKYLHHARSIHTHSFKHADAILEILWVVNY